MFRSFRYCIAVYTTETNLMSILVLKGKSHNQTLSINSNLIKLLFYYHLSGATQL